MTKSGVRDEEEVKEKENVVEEAEKKEEEVES